jgi:hypothetical protein
VTIVTLVIIAWQFFQGKEKHKYQKAIAKFEGGGIRRGLSPPEIGVILGKPFHQVLTLIIVGLLEKGFIIFHDDAHFKFRVHEQMQTRELSINASKRAEFRRRGAQKLIQTLLPFEEPFLELFEQEDGKSIDKIDFGVTVTPFFQWIAERVGGFNLDQTREYYENLLLKFSGKGDSGLYLADTFIRGIDWNLLNMYISDDFAVDLDDRPNWFSDAKGPSADNQSNPSFIEWLQSLEEAIKTGLSQDDLEINLNRLMNKISSDTIQEIVHTTYHS